MSGRMYGRVWLGNNVARRPAVQEGRTGMRVLAQPDNGIPSRRNAITLMFRNPKVATRDFCVHEQIRLARFFFLFFSRFSNSYIALSLSLSLSLFIQLCSINKILQILLFFKYYFSLHTLI